MEMYLLKSAACMAILLLFYKLLLEKENMHVAKRIYLLATPLISFGIPLITFPEYIEISSEALLPFSSMEDTNELSERTSGFPLFEWAMIGIYVLGVLFFGSRFFLNLRSLLKKASTNLKIRVPGATQVLLKDEVDPHTFWSYIYLNRKKFETKQIPQEVLDHEMAHARQKHTADVIFMELLQIFLWFLPLVYLLKKAVKLNHEFLADREVIQKSNDLKPYQQVLLSFSSGENCSLVNSINYQSIKKRFTVMKKQPSQKAVLVRTFIFLPLLAILLYSFSTREIILVDSKPTEANEIIQKEATPKMLDEYNVLAKRVKSYNEQSNYGKISPEDVPPIKQKEIERMNFIYSSMSKEQKAKVASLPGFYPPPPPPPAQEKATPEMVAVYNKWAKHYKNNEDALVEKKVWERMKYIHSIMTPDQKKGSEDFPSLKPKQIITVVEKKDSDTSRAAVRQEREVIREERRELREQRAAEREEHAAVRQEREVIREERGAQREERAAERAERREMEIQRRVHRDIPSPPPPPPAPPVHGNVDVPSPPVPEHADIPAPPPPPPSPEEAVQGWIEEGAEFFYNGKKVSGQEALKAVQENKGKNLSVQVKEDESGKTVRISDNKKVKGSQPKTSATNAKKYTNPMKRSETIEHLRQLADEGVVFTYLGKEISLNETIKHLERKVTLRYSEVNNKRIMRVEDL